MKKSYSYYLILLTLFLSISENSAQTKGTIKTNVLSLLLTIPQVSIEMGLGKNTSITLSGFSGSYTFISESKVRGANLLFRKYFSDKKILSGMYAELGPVIDGEYFFFENRWDDNFGARAGLGWQFTWKAWVFDIGAAYAAKYSEYKLYDANGQPTGEKQREFEPFARLNASVGFRF